VAKHFGSDELMEKARAVVRDEVGKIYPQLPGWRET